MSEEKVKLSVLIRELELAIKAKDDGLNSQAIDMEVLSYISIYRHGRDDYKEIAKKWLITFLVNADFVKGKRSIVI